MEALGMIETKGLIGAIEAAEDSGTCAGPVVQCTCARRAASARPGTWRQG